MADWYPASGLTYAQFRQQTSLLGDVVAAQGEASEAVRAGLEDVGDLLGSEIRDLGASFNWGLGEVLGSLGGMSSTLEELLRVARTPAQTAAYEQFEIARDAFRRGLLPECLEALGKAINGDHVSPGYKLEWRFHHLAGVVRLGFDGCDPSLVKPEQAEEAFLAAARYAEKDAPKDAARALVAASWAAYVDQRLPGALAHALRAASLDPKLGEAYFQLAKVRLTSGSAQEALELALKAASFEPDYLAKVARDGEFLALGQALADFLRRAREDKLQELRLRVSVDLAAAALEPELEGAAGQAVERWRSLEGRAGGWSTVQLFSYANKGLDADQRVVDRALEARREVRRAEEEKARREEEARREKALLALEKEIEPGVRRELDAAGVSADSAVAKRILRVIATNESERPALTAALAPFGALAVEASRFAKDSAEMGETLSKIPFGKKEVDECLSLLVRWEKARNSRGWLKSAEEKELLAKLDHRYGYGEKHCKQILIEYRAIDQRWRELRERKLELVRAYENAGAKLMEWLDGVDGKGKKHVDLAMSVIRLISGSKS